jgi:hypothetical protein
MGDGTVRDFTWREVMDQSAAHGRAPAQPGLRAGVAHRDPVQELRALADVRLRHLDGRPRVGAAVPTLAAETIRQILEHSESKLLFVGKLDGWEGMKPGVPAGLPCISFPLSPPNDYPSWDEIVRAPRRCPASRCATATSCQHHHVHLGHHRHAQGRDAQLRHLCLVAAIRPEAGARSTATRAC